MGNRKRSPQELRRFFFRLAGVVLTAAVIWGTLVGVQIYRITPPAAATTLEEFVECMPEPRHLALIDDNGTQKIVWVGEAASLALVSGPAVYLFDTQGQLIDWNLSTGDGETLTRFLEPAFESSSLAIADAIDLASGG